MTRDVSLENSFPQAMQSFSFTRQARLPSVFRATVLPKQSRVQGHTLVSRLAHGGPSQIMASVGTEQLDKSTSEEKWKQILGKDEYYVLRQKGTEGAGTGVYNKHTEEGVYRCGGCGTPLYKSETKFDSGCGWPAFYAEIPGTIDRHVDNSMGMKRTEITCSKCGGHMGHVFENEGFKNPTNERHCVNSKALKFAKK